MRGNNPNNIFLSRDFDYDWLCSNFLILFILFENNNRFNLFPDYRNSFTLLVVNISPYSPPNCCSLLLLRLYVTLLLIKCYGYCYEHTAKTKLRTGLQDVIKDELKVTNHYAM